MSTRTKPPNGEEKLLQEAAEWELFHLETEQLYHDVREFLTDYIVFSSPFESVAITLWILHTHLISQFQTTPRLVIKGPDKQCGKSRLLEVLELLCNHPKMALSLTRSAFFRRITDSGGEITILQDEHDAIFTGGSGDEDKRAAYNGGWRRKGGVIEIVEGSSEKRQVKSYNVFAPVAFAGIGDLPDTIEDRSLIINLRRKLPHEKVKEFDSALVDQRGAFLQKRIAAWVKSVSLLGNDHRLPVMPDGLRDRARDIWRPLVWIAELAGEHDEPWVGPWPEAARATCQFMCDVQAQEDDDTTVGKRLLHNIRSVFSRPKTKEWLLTDDLIYELQLEDEWEWNAKEYGSPVLDANKLARMLKEYKIKPTKLPRLVDKQQRRGYHVSMFEDAWARWLSDETGEEG